MKKLKLSSSIIIDKIAIAFVGDDSEHIPFPYRGGSELVKFFNDLGSNDEYRQGFPTRWRYAKEKIESLFEEDNVKEFFEKALSYEGLLTIDSSLGSEVAELQHKIIENLNKHILCLTDSKIILKNNKLEIKCEENMELLGEGYFAKVFLDQIDAKNIAIKKLKDEHKTDREYKHRFKREYIIMESLNESPYTIDVYNYNEEEYSFEMECADSTLKEYIEINCRLLNLSKKEKICEQIILGMKDLHKTSIHRDLSYKNILMVNKIPKLSDFGLGKNLKERHSYDSLSEKGVGTYDFTDPIQRENIKKASVQTDIYSLGVIIDYIFSGTLLSEEHKYTGLVHNAKHRDLKVRYKSIEELHSSFLEIKELDQNFDPVSKLLEMYEKEKMNPSKIYTYFIRKDGGSILFDLILESKKCSFEVLDLFNTQYNHELKELLRKMHIEFEDRRLDYEDYDDFGYVSMNLLKEVDNDIESAKILARIIDYCAENVNRFNIQRLIRDNKNNRKIPYSIRKNWVGQY